MAITLDHSPQSGHASGWTIWELGEDRGWVWHAFFAGQTRKGREPTEGGARYAAQASEADLLRSAVDPHRR